MLPAPPPPTDDYGFDRFVVGSNGERLRVLMVRTIEPSKAGQESNADFAERMHTLACILQKMDGVLAVEYEIEIRDGHAVMCRLECFTAPMPVAVIEDAKPAGGRFGERGRRAA